MAMKDELQKLLDRAAPGIDRMHGGPWQWRRDGDVLVVENPKAKWAFRLMLAPEVELQGEAGPGATIGDGKLSLGAKTIHVDSD